MERVGNSSLYINRFSILLAFLALSFALLFLLPANPVLNSFDLLGIQFELSFQSLIPFFLALVTASACVWVYFSHPIWQGEKLSLGKVFPHLMLPFIATMILSVVLIQSARSVSWWMVYIFGFMIVSILLRAEYVLIDEAGTGQTGYSILVISFSFGLFLLLSIALKNSGIRIVAQFIFFLLSSFFVSFRLLSLRTGENEKFLTAVIASWLLTQFAVVLHYIFIPPIQYGILLTGLLYSLTSFLSLYQKQKKWHQYPEAIIMSIVTLILVITSSIF
ncbi:MAG: hypothetical protein KBA03_04615 [Anaerolineaceae bacterium]|nr:hypothetical protein [Anaerolineaceae bacterium]